MSIRSYIPSSLTVGFMTLLLVFGLSSAVLGATGTQNVSATVTKIRTINISGPVSLTADRGNKVSVNAGTLNFVTDHTPSSDKITVSVTEPGSPVAGAALNIKGGDIGTGAGAWSELWSYDGSSHTTSSATIVSALESHTGSINNLQYQLDATGVAAGAANLDTEMSFTVTYTITST